LGLASLLIDRLDEAAASFREGLELSVEIGQSGLQACCVDGLAAIASARGAHEVSARLIGHSEAVLARAGAVLQPIESALHERTLEKVRAQLGASAVDAALDAGRRMLPKEAIAQALSID